MLPREYDIIDEIRNANDLLQLSSYGPAIKQELSASNVMIHVRLARQLGYTRLYSSFEDDWLESDAIWGDPRSEWAHHLRIGIGAARIKETEKWMPHGASSYGLALPAYMATGEAVAVSAWFMPERDNSCHETVTTVAMCVVANAILGALTKITGSEKQEDRRSIITSYAAAGYSAKQIARALGLSPRTVEAYKIR